MYREVMSVTSTATSVRRRENTRARLLTAAEAVFVRKGVRRVTVDDLVGEAGFTRGAFYSNFSSIEEVFYELFRLQSEAMLAIVREVVDEASEEEFSIGLVLERLRPISSRWYVIQAEFTLLALRNTEARELFQDHRAMLEEQMVGLIGDVVRRLGRVPTVPLEQLTETAVALYLHSLAQEGLGMGTLDTAALTEIVLPQVIVGLSRPV
jgi:AcrR family transcriptional regulator